MNYKFFPDCTFYDSSNQKTSIGCVVSIGVAGGDAVGLQLNAVGLQLNEPVHNIIKRRHLCLAFQFHPRGPSTLWSPARNPSSGLVRGPVCRPRGRLENLIVGITEKNAVGLASPPAPSYEPTGNENTAITTRIKWKLQESLPLVSPLVY